MLLAVLLRDMCLLVWERYHQLCEVWEISEEAERRKACKGLRYFFFVLRKGESFWNTKTTNGTYWQTLVKELQENLIFPVMSHNLECYSFCMSNSIIVNRSASDALVALNLAQKGTDVGMLEKQSNMLHLFWKHWTWTTEELGSHSLKYASATTWYTQMEIVHTFHLQRSKYEIR